MNKTELISAVAAKSESTKKDAEKAVNAVLAVVSETLAGGDSVQIAGFGTFEVRERAEKQGRNPRTGETITVPAAKVPAFKAGRGLKDAVSGK
ncbi:MAG: HU family DNA-binding protein [Clostridia bacterium]|nr:HU family DNA-binding protein [Clostridia bacterium]